MKKISLILRKCKSLSRQLGRSSSYSSLRSKSTREDLWGDRKQEDENHETIFVGSTRKRYVIDSKYLSHPLVNALIEKSKQKAGEENIVVVKCEVVFFDHLLWMLENADPNVNFDSMEDMEASLLRKAIIVEINLISAQELMSKSKSSSTPMQTYVVGYINPKEKAVSRVDRTGNTNPTWNDKFLFALDEELERSRPNCCLVLEIYRVRRFRKDERIGVVHVLLEDLLKIKGLAAGEAKVRETCMTFLVQNPSGEPHGIINIGAATLNGMFHETLPKIVFKERVPHFLAGKKDTEDGGSSPLKTLMKAKKASTNDFYARKMGKPSE
ncbi:unnamed protein product [Dovyalis caffra]|uniref:C2 domain-containing protein n=1 Tax=Dovyalis caffra TaxID=77055 RepID=A0AAV1SU94_9ROSI|nr:unnamed protein product [Dovyalis caffra]